jgi:hypothetical protein
VVDDQAPDHAAVAVADVDPLDESDNLSPSSRTLRAASSPTARGLRAAPVWV